MNKYHSPPKYHTVEYEGKKLLNHHYLLQTDTLLDLVKVSSINSRFYVTGDPTFSLEFYNSNHFKERSEQWTPETASILIRYNFYTSNIQRQYLRQVYGFLDLLSDLGGVHEIIMVILGGLIFSISEHHYTL